MLMRNLDPAKGACNGTRFIVERLNQFSIEARFLFGNRRGQIYKIPRITLRNDDSKKYSLLFDELLWKKTPFVHIPI